MRLTTKASDLKDRVKVISSSLTQKGQDECLMTASKTEGLTIEGFKDGTYLKCTLPAEVYEEGEVVVKSAYLTSLKLGGQVTLTLNGTRLDFSAGKFKGHIETSQDLERFKSSRPAQTIPTPFNMTGEAFSACFKRAYLQPTLVGQPYGICCKLYGDEGDKSVPATLELSSIESGMRAVLVKQRLPQIIPREDGASHVFLDVVLPPVVATIANKIKGPIQIGTDGQAFRLFSGDFDLYQPMLGLDVLSVDQWISMLPVDKAKTFIIDATKMKTGIAEATSVAVSVGSSQEEIHLDCTAAEELLHINVSAASGKASSEVQMMESVDSELKMLLGARHISESLNLLDKGPIEVKIWSKPAAVLVSSGPTKEKIEAETDPEKLLQLQGQMQTLYIIPQVERTS